MEIMTSLIIYSKTWVQHFTLTTGTKCRWQCNGDTRTHVVHAQLGNYLHPMSSSVSFDPISSVPLAITTPTPTAEQIRALSEETWSRCACWFQAQIVSYLLAPPKCNLVATAATGTGKTYTFFLPALYEKSGVTFIIVPLKKLAHQHCDSAVKLGLTAISLEAETIGKDVINVSLFFPLHQPIGQLPYRT